MEAQIGQGNHAAITSTSTGKNTRQDNPRRLTAAIDAIPAKSEASHALKDIKTFFNWCVPRYLPHSPCVGIKPPSRYIPRERLLSMDELAAIWRAAETLGQYGQTGATSDIDPDNAAINSCKTLSIK